MNPKNVLCLAIDGLRPDALGVYGDPSGITPGLDRLAAGACVFDFAFCESPELASFYRAVWRGEHPLRSQNKGKPCNSIIHAVSQSSYRTGLVTDDPHPVEFSADEFFSDVIEVPCSEAASQASCNDGSDTAEIVMEAVDWVSKNDQTDECCKPHQPWLLWIHFGGLTHAWETADISADEYTARLESLDLDVDMLLHTLSSRGQLNSALILLIGCRGFPMGEHGEYGYTTGLLFEELSHVPLLLRLPGEMGALERVGGLVCAADVAATVAEWCRVSEGDWSTEDGRSLLSQSRDNDVSWRESLLLANQYGETGVRTDDWYLRFPNSGDKARSHPVELYSKPDDRWDANEVGGLCEKVVSEMLARRQRLMSRFHS